MKLEKREFVRIPINLPVKISLKDTLDENETFDTQSKDLSIGGICVDSPYQEPLPLRRSVRLIIDSPQEGLHVDLTGEIVWTRKKESPLAGYNLGIKFIELDNGIKNRLTSYIQERPYMEKGKLPGKIEDFIYKVVIKNILLLSRLGRNSISGWADTGLNFDHMYKNKPEGRFLIGRFIDRVLLNLPAVKATRNRKTNILKILYNEIENNRLVGKKTKILDIASGPSRYLNELISDENKGYIEGVCLDRDANSLKEGRGLARDKPIRYIRADVFKLDHLVRFSKGISWEPNIVIVSGLYVYVEDGLVKKSLKDIFSCLERDGLVIFCSQLDNPSKKLMGKVCTTHVGKSWKLYYRTPRQLRRLMIEIGYKYNIISLDPIGMYELCTGRKV